MSEKITFRELIESIAEETDNSKQFTHDFIKDFVDVINGGLEEDGSVNIAGFGKFELRRMDERGGYNPQTEEKITIPAHNKIVFKPYKDLRELVNAPYAHLEPELIEENNNSEQEDASDDTETGDQDNFIPTAPPTSEKSSDESNTEDALPFSLDEMEDDKENDIDRSTADTDANRRVTVDDFDDLGLPFDLEDEDQRSSEEHQQSDKEIDNNDVVQFNDESEEKEEESNFLDQFISPIEPSDKPEDSESLNEQDKEMAPEEQPVDEDKPVTSDEVEETFQPEHSSEEESNESDEPDEENVPNQETGDEKSEDKPSPFSPDFVEDANEENETEDEEPEEKQSQSTSFYSPHPSHDTTSNKLPIFAAVAVVLIIAAASALYFTLSSSEMPQMTADGEMKSTTQKTSQQSNQATTQNARQNQNQTTASSVATAQTSNKTTKGDNENLEIERGQTLWSIAEEKYGNPRLWPWIYGNNDPLEDPDIILAGHSLSIPLPSGPQNSLNFVDSIGVAKGFLSTYRWYKNNESMKARNHLWAAKSYHEDIRSIASIKIDKEDLIYANQAR